jgi:hypothetical protein
VLDVTKGKTTVAATWSEVCDDGRFLGCKALVSECGAREVVACWLPSNETSADDVALKHAQAYSIHIKCSPVTGVTGDYVAVCMPQASFTQYATSSFTPKIRSCLTWVFKVLLGLRLHADLSRYAASWQSSIKDPK